MSRRFIKYHSIKNFKQKKIKKEYQYEYKLTIALSTMKPTPELMR